MTRASIPRSMAVVPTRASSRWLLAPLLIGALPGEARSQDVFVGVYQHDAKTFLTSGIDEHGADLEVGYRFAPITRLAAIGEPSPYLVASLNTRGDTSFAAAGLSWRFGGPLYVRPGIGLAVHTGPSYRVDQNNIRTDLGSRVLFEPELALGYRILPCLSLEASWTHLSHAKIFGGQNPGVDMLGARLNLHLR